MSQSLGNSYNLSRLPSAWSTPSWKSFRRAKEVFYYYIGDRFDCWLGRACFIFCCVIQVMGLDAMILVFWMLSFKPTLSPSSFIFIKRLYSSCSLSAIRVVPSAYLRLLIFLLATLIPACSSSSPAFLMMYSAYKLNKQGDNIQPWCTPFLIWNQSVVPRPALTCAYWPAYRFLRRQVMWSGIPISKNFPKFVMIYTVKDFSIVNKAEVDNEIP